MSGLDVEALLDSTANSAAAKDQANQASLNGESPNKLGGPDTPRGGGNQRQSQDRDGPARNRSPDRRSSIQASPSEHGKEAPRSDSGSHRSRRRSRSRDSDRRRSRRDRDGDYYRSRGRRSRSPNGYHRYRGGHRRDRDRERDRERDRDRDDRGYRRRDDDRDRPRGDRRSSARDTPTPAPLTDDDRDRRTVFVQQLAARLRTRELKEFFEKAGPVAEAQIVKDRVSNRSKGYVCCLAASFLSISYDEALR